MTFEDLPPICVKDVRTGAHWSPIWRAACIDFTGLDPLYGPHDVRVVPGEAAMDRDLHDFLLERALRRADQTGDERELQQARAFLSCQVSDHADGLIFVTGETFVHSDLEPVRDSCKFVEWQDIPTIHRCHPLPGTPEHYAVYGC